MAGNWQEIPRNQVRLDRAERGGFLLLQQVGLGLPELACDEAEEFGSFDSGVKGEYNFVENA